LEQVQALGAISMCANPDALPYSSAKGDPPGFQVEIGRAIAERLGLKLNVDWIVPRRRAAVVNCDMLLDSINDPAAYEGRLLLSTPYQRTGIALGLRARDANGVNGLGDLRKGQKVGVMIGSVSSVLIGNREHPDAALRVVPLFDQESELAWTMSVGLRKSDRALLDAVNGALDKLLAD